MPSRFTLDHDGLERIFRAWSIPRPKTGYVIFGLRGALPLDASKGWVPSVRLETSPVDHLHLRCTLGLWDPARKRIFAAPGSTVPHRDNMRLAAERGGKGTNQLEPGFYRDLTKGEHLQGKLNGHAALRQTASRFYRRSPDGKGYGPSSPLFFGNPYDNLHCAWNLLGTEPGFRSAGCLVVAGMPHCPRHEKPEPNQGAWKLFHGLLYAAKQSAFPILVLPAAEAADALAGKAAPKSRPRLVFGSEGDGVKALQRKLASQGLFKGRADGLLGSRTYKAWNASGFAAA